ncbi:MAG: hypothetical protein BM557_01010 [Flavobacterium sp. MedPE-SWcel]|uniref:hypothetical protein n=1 Tax=uncultured Flavobacterium sp. TaxID=165435 RepID=UPI0009199895|nr:hypothetical protein [uncultured Flavobacterium sp.]OIQ22596.1 MAG: hypothetical protein BM557_01010 [Flavobacterium sp. MedPE-SWcel]
MKKSYYLILGVTLILATACGPRVRRYGCRKGRCITSTVKEQGVKIKKALPVATLSSNSKPV